MLPGRFSVGSIVSGTETAPVVYRAKVDVFGWVEVWKKLKDQFQKSTWANKLSLRHKLYGLKLKDIDSVHDQNNDGDLR